MPLPSDAIALDQQPTSKLPADAIALDNPTPKQDTGISGQDIQQHPFQSIAKTIMQPAAKSLTGKSLEEQQRDKDLNSAGNTDFKGMNADEIKNKLSDVQDSSLKNAVGAQIGDMATTPINYVGGKLIEPVAKGIGSGVNAIGKGISNISKSAPNYVTDVVAPKAYQIYQDAVSKFTPEIQKFADKLNIPKSAIDTIKKNGVQDVMNTRQQLGDSTDSIVQRLNSGIENFRNNADKVYQTAMDNAPEGKSINIKPSINAAGNKLRNLGLITKNGNLTELGNSEIARDSVYGKLLDFYKSADSISGIEGIKAKAGIKGIDSISGKGGADLTVNQGSKLIQSRFNTNVNKDQYQFFRDKLNSLYKGKPSDVDVSDVVNQFYKDGENSGIKGLQNARILQKKAFDIEDNYSNLVKERSFDKFHTLPQEQIRNMQSLERKVGVPFMDDLEKVSAGKYLDKLNEYNPDKFVTDLNAAKDKGMINHIQSKYEDLLGKQNAKNVFDEVRSHVAGQNTKSGLLKAGSTITGVGAGYEVGRKIFGH